MDYTITYRRVAVNLDTLETRHISDSEPIPITKAELDFWLETGTRIWERRLEKEEETKDAR